MSFRGPARPTIVFIPAAQLMEIGHRFNPHAGAPTPSASQPPSRPYQVASNLSESCKNRSLGEDVGHPPCACTARADGGGGSRTAAERLRPRLAGTPASVRCVASATTRRAAGPSSSSPRRGAERTTNRCLLAGMAHGLGNIRQLTRRRPGIVWCIRRAPASPWHRNPPKMPAPDPGANRELGIS